MRKAKTKIGSEKDSARKIADMIAVIEKRLLKDENVKFTVGDYIRLLEAQQELDRETPRDIEVTWIETLKRNDAEK